jgi:CheY-like chemotaxis protein
MMVKMTPLVYEILLAEDNPADVTLVREALSLQEIECRLHVITDGVDVLGFVEKAPPLDLVLMDLHLPKCEGSEILKRLRASSRNANVPVVIMTSAAAPDEYKSLDDFSVTSYFVKPSDLESFMKLGKICRDILDKHASDTFGSEVEEQLKMSIPVVTHEVLQHKRKTQLRWLRVFGARQGRDE